jgi:2-polyprenyl-6-methoxyphenol hydroxylase-like FAD-dependent oxidoreductase
MIDRRSSHTHTHAVVIGGGLAGLLAGRVLSDHFARVTLIERDAPGGAPVPRKGVPQGNHVHGLLAKGCEVLAQLFPDLVPALLAGGAVAGDMGRDIRWHHHGAWKARFDSGIEGILFTRPYLEWHIAERVKALANVRILNAAVDGIEVDAARTRVVGIKLRAPVDGDTRLPADLVVDAGGRGSHMPQWLEAIGFRAPSETTVQVDVMYASRLYRRAPHRQELQALLVSPHAPRKRMGMMFAVEGDRWLVTLGGLHGDHPPTDEAGYLEFARRLPVPDLHQAIAAAEPLTAIATHKFPANRRRHYEALDPVPDRLMIVGDAFCSFNPIYGQGMTVSALEALALERMLREQSATGEGLAGLSARFHATIADIVDVPWGLTTGEDFRHAETRGPRPPLTPLLHWYTGRMHQRCAHDAALALAFYRVMHMIEAPSALFRPATAWRILGPRRGVPAPDYVPAPAPSSLW